MSQVSVMSSHSLAGYTYHKKQHLTGKPFEQILYKFKVKASGGNIVVEHGPPHPNVKGLSPATAAVTEREIIVRKSLETLITVSLESNAS